MVAFRDFSRTRSGNQFRGTNPQRKASLRNAAQAAVQGYRNSTNQLHIEDLEAALDHTRAEGYIAPVRDTERAWNGGYIRYGAVHNGQRSGVEARLTPAMVRQGSPASYRFPFVPLLIGAIGGPGQLVVVRGHLLARVLGGSGAEPGNLVPLPHHTSNLPMYADVEQRLLMFLLRDPSHEASVQIDVIYPDANALLPSELRYRATNPRSGANLLANAVVRMPIRF